LRAVVQRVSSASVTIEGAVCTAIKRGLLVLLGVAEGDTPADGEWLAQKIARLRIFPVVDLGGEVLVVSQFTLLASTRKGTRPSFNDAAKPDTARVLYESFLPQLEAALGGRPVARGEFAAMMQVALVNDGPVTILLDTRQRD
jgi:D-tyrosyl-tRNA(Tyr) deacylase